MSTKPNADADTLKTTGLESCLDLLTRHPCKELLINFVDGDQPFDFPDGANSSWDLSLAAQEFKDRKP